MRTKKGIVGSTKMTGTVSVSVDAHAFHPIYKKRFLRTKKFLADTNDFTVHTGDEVEITECRPLSKNKYFKITNIIKSVAQVGEISDEKDIELALRREKNAPEQEKDSKENAEKETEESSASPDSSESSDKDSPDAK